MENSDHFYDVIVVGAGLSGLSACSMLTKQGLDVLVLEARDRVGGRTHTLRDDQFKYADVGGSYVGPSQNRILRLAHEVGVQSYKINSKGNYTIYINGKVSLSKTYNPQTYNPFVWLDINNLFRQIDALAMQIDPQKPWAAKMAKQWDSCTFLEFLKKTCWSREAFDAGLIFANLNVATEPCQISLLWMLWYVRSGGGTKRLNETKNAAQERKLLGGSMMVCEKLHARMKENVILNSPVASVVHSEDCVSVTTRRGDSYKARYLIMTVPLSLLNSVHFSPSLPFPRSLISQQVPMGACIKNFVQYKEPFWRKNGQNGFTTVIGSDMVVGNAIDDTKPDGSVPALTGFILGDRAREMSLCSREERREKTIECYVKLFGQQARDYLNYEEGNWLSEEFSGGCYTSTYPPGVLTSYMSTIRDPVGRVHFAGTETAVKWSGYMDGAVEAGERAAGEVLYRLGKIQRDQIEWEEPECKDVSDVPFTYSFIERNAPSISSLIKYGGVFCASLLLVRTLHNYEQLTWFSKVRTMYKLSGVYKALMTKIHVPFKPRLLHLKDKLISN